MTNSRVALQPAYVLHQRAYRDTSSLLELLTPEHGRIGLVARGSRGAKPRWRGLLQPFQPLLVSWTLRGELGTLTEAEAKGAALTLAPAFLASGFYLNEVLLRLLHRHEPQLALFGWYDMALRGLADLSPQEEASPQALEILLRRFEIQLLTELGYGLVFDHDVESGAPIAADGDYRYQLERGPVRVDAAQREEEAEFLGPLVSGATLLALQQHDLSAAQTRQQAKRLLRGVLAHYLGPKPLHSRQLMQNMNARQDGHAPRKSQE
jgi:DNA repair protein RecO (recombination protein O)